MESSERSERGHVGWGNHTSIGGNPVSTIGVFGILPVLYVIVMAVLIGLAIYVLVLAIIFLRLRIAELKRAQPPQEDTQRQ